MQQYIEKPAGACALWSSNFLHTNLLQAILNSPPHLSSSYLMTQSPSTFLGLPWWSEFSLLLVSVITVFSGRGLSALSPSPWSLSFNLFDMGGPSRSQRLQVTQLYGSLSHTNHSTTVRWWSFCRQSNTHKILVFHVSYPKLAF